LQGGWFPFIWSSQTFKLGEDFYPETYSPEQIQNLTMYCIQNGETILNYYMLFGGTNLDNTDSKDMQTSYDYGAPIREHGGVGEKYKRVKAIGMMIQKHGCNLTTSFLDTTYNIISDNKDVDATVRVDEKGNRYIFIRNENQFASYSGEIIIQKRDEKFNIKYQLGKFDSKMLYLPAGEKNINAGEWYPQLFENKDKQFITSPKIKTTSIIEMPEAFPLEWNNGVLGESLLDWGIYDNRYVYYKAVFYLNKEEVHQNLYLHVSYPYIKAGTLHSNGKGIPDDVIAYSKTGNILLKKGKS